MNNENGNRPVFSVRFGSVKAAVWRNAIDNGEVRGAFYNVTCNRSYRDVDDNWHDTQSFGYEDLLPLAKAIDQCHSWIAEQISRDATCGSTNRDATHPTEV